MRSLACAFDIGLSEDAGIGYRVNAKCVILYRLILSEKNCKLRKQMESCPGSEWTVVELKEALRRRIGHGWDKGRIDQTIER